MNRDELLSAGRELLLGLARSKMFVVCVVAFGVLTGFYLSCVHFTDQYHVAIVRNNFTGEVWCDMRGGIHLTAPWTQASRIDTRPQRVCITTTAMAYNCKLVQFQPEAYGEFVKVQGFYYYWWANRISFNLGYGEEYRGMKDILRGFAFGAVQYPFLTVLADYAP